MLLKPKINPTQFGLLFLYASHVLLSIEACKEHASHGGPVIKGAVGDGT
jgi:hypothetical protein